MRTVTEAQVQKALEFADQNFPDLVPGDMTATEQAHLAVAIVREELRACAAFNEAMSA